MWRVEIGGVVMGVKSARRSELDALARVRSLCPDVPEVLAELDGAIVLSWIEGATAGAGVAGSGGTP